MRIRTCAVCTLALTLGCGSHPRAGERPAPAPEAITPVRVSGPGGNIAQAEIRNMPSARTRNLAAPADSVWSALPAAFEQLGIPAGADHDQKVLGNPEFRVKRIEGALLSSYVDCGRGVTAVPLADDYDVTLSVLTQVTPSGEGWSLVATTVSGRAKPRAVSGAPVYCQSTGKLEQRIVDLVLRSLSRDR
jgi:hypothetical protein